MSTYCGLSFNGWCRSWDRSCLIRDNVDSITANKQRSGINGLLLDRGIIQRDCSGCLDRVLMTLAGCWYRFCLCDGDWLENTALDIGKGKLCGEMVTFWKNGVGSCFGQDRVN